MLRLALKITTLTCAFALGYLAKPEKVRIQNIPGPTQLVFPTANRGVEVQTGLRWVNLEAETPIFQVDNEQLIRAVAGITPDNPGFIEGLYTPPPNEAIYVLGTWDLSAETALHEFVHMLEANMPDQAWRIRKAFHKLCSDKFRIDSMDLQPELPAPAPSVGIVVAP